MNITFSFESSKLKGKSLVAFEHLYWDGIEVQAHEDINDTDQTVTIPSLKLLPRMMQRPIRVVYAAKMTRLPILFPIQD